MSWPWSMVLRRGPRSALLGWQLPVDRVAVMEHLVEGDEVARRGLRRVPPDLPAERAERTGVGEHGHGERWRRVTRSRRSVTRDALEAVLAEVEGEHDR